MCVSMFVANQAINPSLTLGNEGKEVKKPMDAHAMPKVAFTVLKELDVFGYNSLSSRIARFAWLFFSFVIIPIGFVRLIGKIINYIAIKKYILPAVKIEKAILDKQRDDFMKDPKNAQQCERIAIKTADRVTLDTMLIRHPNQEAKPAEQRKCIIYFNRNETAYESMLPSLMKMSNELGVNIYCGNYRGVGYSQGFPTEKQDLIMDGEAMVQYLRCQIGVSLKNINIHGCSLGGAIAAEVASLHQEKGNEISLCSDRSFTSTVELVRAFVRNRYQKLKEQKTCKANFKAAFLNLMTSLAIGLIYIERWNFKSLDCCKTIKNKFFIYHREDPAVPYSASVYKRLKESQITHEYDRERLERKVQKDKRRIEGLEKVIEDVKKPYRPNAIKLDPTIKQELIHTIPLEDTEQFEKYKAQMTLALI